MVLRSSSNDRLDSSNGPCSPASPDRWEGGRGCRNAAGAVSSGAGLSWPASGTHSAVRLAVVPLSGGLGGDQRSPTVNIRRNSEDCAHRPGEILKPLNNRNASPAEWRGSARRGRQPLTGGLTDALRFGGYGEDERASCWQDVRNSGGFVQAHEWLWR